MGRAKRSRRRWRLDDLAAAIELMLAVLREEGIKRASATATRETVRLG
jgi:hypothetical protein